MSSTCHCFFDIAYVSLWRYLIRPGPLSKMRFSVGPHRVSPIVSLDFAWFSLQLPSSAVVRHEDPTRSLLL